MPPGEKVSNISLNVLNMTYFVYNIMNEVLGTYKLEFSVHIIYLT